MNPFYERHYTTQAGRPGNILTPGTSALLSADEPNPLNYKFITNSKIHSTPITPGLRDLTQPSLLIVEDDEEGLPLGSPSRFGNIMITLRFFLLCDSLMKLVLNKKAI